MIDRDHPMFQQDRPLIPTRPAERFGNAVALAMEAGHRGIWVYGDGRIGKSKAARMLSLKPNWLPWRSIFFEVNYPKPTTSSEGYFFNAFLDECDLKTVKNAFGTDSMARLRNHLIDQSRIHSTKVITGLINEANRFSLTEFEHLVTFEDHLEKRDRRLFLILISQTDAEENGPQRIETRPPSQIFGRFLNASHNFTGLLWSKPEKELNNGLENDVVLALMEYDNGLIFPYGSGVTCTHFFAKKAYERGWRLASQWTLYQMEIERLRAKHGLPPVAPWPMKTFEAFVYFLLVRIAGDNPNFVEATPADVQLALELSGYIELELSRYPEVTA
jgi:hypothetical protein